MKQRKTMMALVAISAWVFISCQKNAGDHAIYEDAAGKPAGITAAREKTEVGYVYTLSNETGNNRVLTYSRSVAGTLHFEKGYATGGTGTGGGLGNQGAVTLTENHDYLLAVNAGSHSVSSFAVHKNGLELISTVSSAGLMPVSVTIHENLVYVLNAGGTGNIAGFWMHADGSLHPIAGSSRPLSSAAAGAAQISFVQDGKVVVITEKATNKIISYTIGLDGIAGMMHAVHSSNPTPFGFAAGSNGMIYVSEAVGGAPGASTVSAYHVSTSGTISLVDGPESAGQTAACWVVLTNNEKYVYATNTGSNNLSSFSTSKNGNLDVLSAIAANTMISVPIDAALTNNSKYLYVLNAGDESITSMFIEKDGGLSYIQNVQGLPDGATGLAAK